MYALLHITASFLAKHTLETIISVVAFLGATLVALAREQLRAGTTWALTPLIHALPWNTQFNRNPVEHAQLISDFSLIDVFLCDASGKFARYQKTSSYVVTTNELNSYQEGVTTEGHADGFSSMRGEIGQTFKEHGFYISRIDLPEALPKGSRFTNVYAVNLHDGFTKPQEHWTQELAFLTKHLTLQIHFPKDRPPKSVKCKTVEGTSGRRAKPAAKIVDLYGKNSIVWEVAEPQLKQILKLEWRW